MPAYAGETGGQGAELGSGFLVGFEEMVDVFKMALPDKPSEQELRNRAVSMVTTLIGAVAKARASRTINPNLPAKILSAARASDERCPAAAIAEFGVFKSKSGSRTSIIDRTDLLEEPSACGAWQSIRFVNRLHWQTARTWALQDDRHELASRQIFRYYW